MVSKIVFFLYVLCLGYSFNYMSTILVKDISIFLTIFAVSYFGINLGLIFTHFKTITKGYKENV